MSDHNMMDHEADTSSNKESGRSDGLYGILRSRYFAFGVTIAVVLVGFLLVRRIGIGGRVLPVVGLVAFMMVAHSFMHRGHGSHGGHGGQASYGAHGGCGASSRQRLESRPAQNNGGESESPDKAGVDRPDSPRGHGGCH